MASESLPTNLEEKWLPVPNFPEYEVSTQGRVRSLARSYQRPNPRKVSVIQTIRVKQQILLGWVQAQKSGYKRKMVMLCRGGTSHPKKVAHLVLEAFVGPMPDGMGSLHSDGDSLNNRLDNLRWGTQLENVLDSVRHGTKTKPPVRYGESHHATTLEEKDIYEIRNAPRTRGMTFRLAEKFGVTDVTIGRIRDRKTWKGLP